MIRHVTLFAWIPEATDDQKQQVVTELMTLPPLLSGLRAFDIGPDAGIVAGNFDFAVVADSTTRKATSATATTRPTGRSSSG